MPRRRKTGAGSIYSFIITWLILSAFMPLYRVWGLFFTGGAALGMAWLFGRISGRNAAAEEKKQKENREQGERKAPRVVKTDELKQEQASVSSAAPKKSYGPQIDPIIEEGNRALSEMGRLYQSIKDPDVRLKINELMRVTDKITQDAIADPSDIPKIKKFLNYYLPTTIKLLNAYDRMGAQGIQGENLDKSMKSINEMLDAAIEAFKKQLDSLFANQALDIETDIEVMNTMLAREGLIGGKDFDIKPTGGTAAQASGAGETRTAN